MSALRIVDDDGGSLVLRTARKPHRCSGSQGLADGRHAADCPGEILVGQQYVECYWNTPAYQSGDRFTEACALALGAEWIERVIGGGE